MLAMLQFSLECSDVLHTVYEWQLIGHSYDTWS